MNVLIGFGLVAILITLCCCIRILIDCEKKLTEICEKLDINRQSISQKIEFIDNYLYEMEYCVSNIEDLLTKKIEEQILENETIHNTRPDRQAD